MLECLSLTTAAIKKVFFIPFKCFNESLHLLRRSLSMGLLVISSRHNFYTILVMLNEILSFLLTMCELIPCKVCCLH